MKNILLTILLSGTAFAQNKLEEVAEFGKNQPIGVAVQTGTNRLFVSFPHTEPFLYAVTEIVNGKRVPYPTEEWNKYLPEKPADHFVNAQDMYADDKGFLWVLDSKPAGAAAVIGEGGTETEGTFKMLKINLATNTVAKIYTFGGLDKTKSALNDVRVDTQNQLAYLSDPGLKAIVVLDLKTDAVRVVLQNHTSTTVTPGYKVVIDGKEMTDDKGKPFKSDVNGIALTKNNKYFYYKPINQDKLYRIATQYLADATLTPAAIATKVETVGNAGVTHGLEADAKGNIYFGNSPEHAIKYISPDGKLHTLVTDDRIIWPDSFGIGADGYLYFSCAQMHRLPKYNNGENRVEYPFRVFRVKLGK